MSDEVPMNREQRRHPEKQLTDETMVPDRSALGEGVDSSSAGRPDQDVTHNTSTGAGGATEYGAGNQRHPSRISSRPPGHGA